jgi:ABC-type bacteriocin/lantibiotic exporter with double-glycine peptidase domain
MHSIDTIGAGTRARLAAAARIALAVLTLGCASYRGTAKDVRPSAVAEQGNWWMVPKFPLVLQEGSHDCGAAALSAVLRFWGRSTTPDEIAKALGKKNERLRAGEMAAYARSVGLNTYVFYGTMTDVVYELRHGRPVIVGLGKKVDDKRALAHYEVAVGYEPQQKQVLLMDPGRGWQIDSLQGFGEEWARSKGVTIVAFLPASDRRVSGR